MKKSKKKIIIALSTTFALCIPTIAFASTKEYVSTFQFKKGIISKDFSTSKKGTVVICTKSKRSDPEIAQSDHFEIQLRDYGAITGVHSNLASMDGALRKGTSTFTVTGVPKSSITSYYKVALLKCHDGEELTGSISIKYK